VWAAEPDVNLLIAGGRTLFSSEVERTIAGWAVDHQRRTKVLMNFPAEKKPWLFGAVDVFAYPSGYESFGIAFLEAWVAGKPVIGCRIGAIPAVIDEGVDGLLVNYHDAYALEDAIVSLVREPERAAALGAAGHAKVLARYTWPAIAREFRRVYLHAIEARTQMVGVPPGNSGEEPFGPESNARVKRRLS
jgi:glycosyltransferase involved in cell wall biosynthesis